MPNSNISHKNHFFLFQQYHNNNMEQSNIQLSINTTKTQKIIKIDNTPR
ncbi:hypothetical protein MtrunA17_Chr4g0027831 [Medicago truncatula]|uniref:Uncharacterized protein n=1 Tax=Medicago truncatula TaxID=3880 RepID=A0A396I7A7_MEDTR|nr:hypothetical protein MtrunA17_Chr4g0027831 [Medicago truncatula]